MDFAIYRRRISRSLEGCRPHLSLGLCLFREEYCLDLFGFLIALPFLDRWVFEPHEIMESWRITTCDGSVQFNWGRHCKVIWLPWCRERVQHEVRRPDGSWAPYVGSYERDKEPDGRGLFYYPYEYALRSGEVQRATATVYVERNRYVWRLFRKTPLFWWLWRWGYCIAIEFDREMGERAGSWKGGTVGCYWELRKGESPEQALRRMEREREFR
jgi:hypothetical protein